MRTRAAAVTAGLGLLGLSGCMRLGDAGQPTPTPPLFAEQDRTAYNNQQIALFVSEDPGWKAWLNAMLASQQATDALVDASRYNTPVWTIIQAIIAAQDAYRVATSFSLPAFTVTSSCLRLPSEVSGAARLSNGLTVRYDLLTEQTTRFDNGSYCTASVGFIDGVNSSRGLPIAAAIPGTQIDWGTSFSHYLVWRQPFWKISTGATLSLSDLVGMIEH